MCVESVGNTEEVKKHSKGDDEEVKVSEISSRVWADDACACGRRRRSGIAAAAVASRAAVDAQMMTRHPHPQHLSRMVMRPTRLAAVAPRTTPTLTTTSVASLTPRRCVTRAVLRVGMLIVVVATREATACAHQESTYACDLRSDYIH
jgi:hypothetical protein